MWKKSSLFSILTGFCLISILLAGCSLPSATPTATPVPPTPNLAPSATLTPSVTPSPLPTLTATTVPTTKVPIVLQKKLFLGVMVYDRKTTEVQAIDFEGKPLGFKSTLPGAEWLGATQVQAFENTVYYYSNKDHQVMRRNSQGVQPLAFIAKSDVIHFLITEDQKRIAWTTEKWGANGLESEIWVADINGANIKKVLYKDPKQNTKSLVYQPLRWLSNGQLIYIEEPSGIGGYILFYGFAELWIVDPATSKFANFSPPTGKDGLCLKQISPDTMTTLSACGGTQAQLMMYNHTSKTTKKVPVVPEQAQAGSVFYSPNGQLIAYATARGNADNENGKLVVMPAAGEAVKIIHEVNGGYLNVLGWVDNNRILFIRYLKDSNAIFIVNQDGSNPVKVADGLFAGLIPVP